MSGRVGVISLLLLAVFLAAEPSPALSGGELLIRSKVPRRRAFPVNEKINPCVDFHAYVCSKAEAEFKLPKDRSKWIFSFSDSSERMLDARKAFFKKLGEGYEPKFERTKNVKRLFRSCMDSEGQKRGELRYVRSTIKKVQELSDAASARAYIQSRYFTPEFSFIDFAEDANLSDPDDYDIVLLVSGLTMPDKKTYLEKAAVEDLENLVRAFFKELKLDNPEARAAAVVKFEKGLAEVYPTPADFRRISTEKNYMARLDWTRNFPNLAMENIYGRLPSRVGIRNWTIDAFYYLNSYLSSAPVEDIKSVILYHTLRDIMDEAYPEFFKVYFQFQNRQFGGPQVRPPRDERCTQLAKGRLGMELDAELIDILFPKSEAPAVEGLAEKIRKSMLRGLEANSWLTPDAKKEAIKKVRVARLMLIRPKSEKDWNFLKLISLTDDNPIENIFTIRRAEIARTLARVRERRNLNEWHMSPLEVNAYYSPSENVFVLPQGILQYPFFDADQTPEENLAAMGMVIGHELGHGVDDNGAKYDYKGVLRQWMSEQDLKAFNERGKNLVEQFNKAGLDGQLTLGENIADNVGLEFAMRAAFPDLEAADIAKARNFFVSYGRLWCGKITPEARRMQVKIDSHSPREARINEQVKHKDLFQKAFACKESDPLFLKAEERVQVW